MSRRDIPISLINPDQEFALWAVLLSAATLGLWAERTRWGANISGAVVTITATFILSNLKIIPAIAPSYDLVWSYLVPLAIPLLLFQANLGRIFREAGPTLIAYILGAIGTVLGTLAAFYLLPLGEEGWKLAALFCATYIGGSVNFVATAEVVGIRSGDLLSAGIAADNLAMTLYFLVLFTIPSIGWLRKIFPSRFEEGMRKEKLGSLDFRDRQELQLLAITQPLAISAIVCAVGFNLSALLDFPKAAILVVSGLMVILATLFSAYFNTMKTAEKLGTLMMQIFFAVIGANANIGLVLQVGPRLFLFAAVILLIHLIFLLISGRLLGLDLAEMVTASNANTGGPTTAAAMAAARNWDKLVTSAILCGTLGYAGATFIGVALGNFLR